MLKIKHLLIVFFILIVILIAIGYVIKNAGIVINNTASMPGWIYKITGDNSTIRSGDIVVVCPSLQQMKPVFDLPAVVMQGGGDCHGMVPLLKLVTGQAGDEVVVKSDSVVINGMVVLNSGQYEMTTLMPIKIEEKHIKLDQDQFFVSGVGSPYSYDSRYFGPVEINNIKFKVKRIL
jgi:conjugative transfer signal peptidase TraF